MPLLVSEDIEVGPHIVFVESQGHLDQGQGAIANVLGLIKPSPVCEPTCFSPGCIQASSENGHG